MWLVTKSRLFSLAWGYLCQYCHGRRTASIQMAADLAFKYVVDGILRTIRGSEALETVLDTRRESLSPGSPRLAGGAEF